MEVPRLGVESEPQLLANATATATADPSHICDLHHSPQQCWILNPLSEARDRTCLLIDDRIISTEPQWELREQFLGINSYWKDLPQVTKKPSTFFLPFYYDFVIKAMVS